METQTAPCQFCGARCNAVYPVFLGNTASQFFVCEKCGSAQIDPPFSEPQLLQYYQNNYFKAEDWEVRKAEILARDYFRKVLQVSGRGSLNGRALEVGAGFGFFAELFARSAGSPIDVVEPSEACVELMRRRGLHGAVYRNLSEVPPGCDYDNVFCFHVAEHFQRLENLLRDAARCLKRGGKFWILTPNASAKSFVALRDRWGWACNNQHYEFLSQKIPENYFLALGFRVVAARDLRPAPIHYPSRWLAAIEARIRSLSSRIGPPRGTDHFRLRVFRRLLHELAKRLYPNQTNWNLCALERLVAGLRGCRPFDELLLVLEKNPVEAAAADSLNKVAPAKMADKNSGARQFNEGTLK